MIRLLYRNRSVAAVAALCVLAIALAACSKSADTLRDTAWELVSLGGNDLIPGTTITLRFASDLASGSAAVSGRAGCNTYGGGYTASEDGLTLSGVYWTEMACMDPPGVMEQERAYLNALNAAARYKVAPGGGGGDRLELYDAGGAQILVFAKEGTMAGAQ